MYVFISLFFFSLFGYIIVQHLYVNLHSTVYLVLVRNHGAVSPFSMSHNAMPDLWNDRIDGTLKEAEGRLSSAHLDVVVKPPVLVSTSAPDLRHGASQRHKLALRNPRAASTVTQVCDNFLDIFIPSLYIPWVSYDETQLLFRDVLAYSFWAMLSHNPWSPSSLHSYSDFCGPEASHCQC